MNRIANFVKLTVGGCYRNAVRIAFGADRLTNTTFRDTILAGTVPPIETVNYETCISCGMCARQCPVDAIEMVPMRADDPRNRHDKEKNFPELNHVKCVYCFQCHDVCPVFTKMKKESAIHPRGIRPQEYTVDMPEKR